MSKANNKDLMAFHPGYYIDEIIEEMGITQEEFAIRLGTTPKTISKLVNGETGVSNDLALKLASLLNSSPEMWLNLQKAYNVEMNNCTLGQLAGDIVELFDCFLADRGIAIVCEDDDEETERHDDPENRASLYGTEFWSLVDSVQEKLSIAWSDSH